MLLNGRRGGMPRRDKALPAGSLAEQAAHGGGAEYAEADRLAVIANPIMWKGRLAKVIVVAVPWERRSVLDWTAKHAAGACPFAVTVAEANIADQIAFATAAGARGASWVILQPPPAALTGVEEATLAAPDDGFQRSGGRVGLHSEHLGHLLGEMQWMQRTYPGLQW